jgi:hypothetical protein
MKIQDILSYSIEDLEKLVLQDTEESNAKLEEYLGEHFKYTRPERVELEATGKISNKAGAKIKKQTQEAIERVEQKNELKALMEKAGIGNIFDAMLKGKK